MKKTIIISLVIAIILLLFAGIKFEVNSKGGYGEQLTYNLQEHLNVTNKITNALAKNGLGLISDEEYLQMINKYFNELDEINFKTSQLKPPRECEKSHKLLLQFLTLDTRAFKNFTLGKINETEFEKEENLSLNILYKVKETMKKDGCTY